MPSLPVLQMDGLEEYMDAAFVQHAFRQMGHDIMSVKIIHDKKTKSKAGYCFVEMANVEQMQRALTNMQDRDIPFTIPKRQFRLSIASYGKEGKFLPDNTLYVGNLTDEVDDLTLYTFFAYRYPSCRNAQILFDEQGNSKGFGWVIFNDEWEQKKALIEMQHMMGCGTKPISVSLASTKKPLQPYRLVPSDVMKQMGAPEVPGQQEHTGYRYTSGYDNSHYSKLVNVNSISGPQLSHHAVAQTASMRGLGTGGRAGPGPSGGAAAAAADTGPVLDVFVGGDESSDDDMLIDPEIEVDIKKENDKFVQSFECLYNSGKDLWGPQIDPLKKLNSTWIDPPDVF